MLCKQSHPLQSAVSQIQSVRHYRLRKAMQLRPTTYFERHYLLRKAKQLSQLPTSNVNYQQPSGPPQYLLHFGCIAFGVQPAKVWKTSLDPRLYFFLFSCLVLQLKMKEAVKKEMMDLIEKVKPGMLSRVINQDYNERRRYL